MKSTSAALPVLLATLVQGPPSAAQGDGSRDVVDCVPAPTIVSCDGDLGEWKGLSREPFRVRRAEDSKDLGGEWAACHSVDTIWIAGWIVDDRFSVGSGNVDLQDRVEIWIDPDPNDGGAEDAHRLLIAPLCVDVEVDALDVRGQRSTRVPLHGIEAGCVLHEERGAYEFEVGIPLATLGIEWSQRLELGFNLVVVDVDPGEKSPDRLSVGGLEPGAPLATLRLSGRPLDLSVGLDSMRSRRYGKGLWWACLVLLAFAGIGFFARWLHQRRLSQRPRWKRWAALILCALCLAAWGAPSAVRLWMLSRADRDLRQRAGELTAIFEDVQRRADLDARLREATIEELCGLFGGEPVFQQGVRHYEILDLRSAGKPGPGEYRSKSSPEVPFREYGLTLDRDADEPLTVEFPPQRDVLEIHLSIAALLPQGRSPQVVDAVQLAYLAEDQSLAGQCLFTIDDTRSEAYGHVSEAWGIAAQGRALGNPYLACRLGSARLGHLDHLVHRTSLGPSVGISKILISRGPDAPADMVLWLSGITLRLGGAGEHVPLRIGSKDRDGFPMAVRDGRWNPEDLLLKPGEEHRIETSSSAALLELDRLRVYFRAEDAAPGAAADAFLSRRRAEVEIGIDGQNDPLIFPLQEQFEIAPEFLSAETPTLPMSYRSFVAAKAPGPNDSEKSIRHYDGLELDLKSASERDGPFVVRHIVVRNPATSGADFVLAGLTAAFTRNPPPLSATPFFEAVDGGGIRATAEVLRWLRSDGRWLLFGIASEGLLRAPAPQVPADLLRMLRGAPLALAEDAHGYSFGRITLGRSKFLVATVPTLRGDRDERLALLKSLDSLETLAVVRNAATLMIVFLSLPFILLVVVDLLTSATRIKTRLTALFLLTSVAPLSVLFVVLGNLVVSEQKRLERHRGLEIVSAARRRLDDLVARHERAIATILSDLARRPELVTDVKSADALRDFLRESAQRLSQGGERVDLRFDVASAGGQGLAATSFFSRPNGERAACWAASSTGLSFARGQIVFLCEARGEVERRSVKLMLGGTVASGAFSNLDLQLGYESMSLLAPLLHADQGSLPGAGVTLAASRIGQPVPGSDAAAAALDLDRSRQALVREVSGLGTRVFDLLLGSSDEPIGILAATVESRPLRVDFGFARIDMVWFVLVLGAVTLASALFLGSVVTEGITKPLGMVRKRAQAIASGQVAELAPAEGLDEVADLANSIRRMSENLRRRIYDQDMLAAATNVLTRTLDLDERVQVALTFLKEALGGSWYCCYLRDVASGKMLLQAQKVFELPHETGQFVPVVVDLPRGILLSTLESGEPRWLSAPEQAPEHRTNTPAENALLPKGQPVLLLPLGHHGRWMGLVIAHTGTDNPLDRLDAKFVSGLLGQVAVALENARLYRVAVEDPETGLYIESFFQARLSEEIERAAASGQRPLALVLFSFLRGDGVQTLSADQERVLVIEGARELRSICRDVETCARTGPMEFSVLVPDSGIARAREIENKLRERLHSRGLLVDAPGAMKLRAGLAAYPDHGASRSFLLDAAQRDLETADPSISLTTETLLERLEALAPDTSFRSARVLPMVRQMMKIAPTNASVLLLGETGTGKEVVAQLIHRLSGRKDQPFVAVHCAALPRGLLESELFGHEKGAFTGADRRYVGRFEQAQGGTLFLDEVAEIPLEVQVKLLRVLQERKVRRLGGAEDVSVDVRVIAATHRNLEKMVELNTFREDLYYRLRVVAMEIPPLRDRLDEIPRMAELFARDFGRQVGREVVGVEPAALDLLHRHAWPGNIRELRNVIQRAVVMGSESIVRREDFELMQRDPLTGISATGQAAASSALKSVPPAGAAPVQPWPATSRSQVWNAAELNPRQERLLQILREKGRITNREFFGLAGISRRTGLRDLAQLLARGMIVRDGVRKAAVYRLRESNELSHGPVAE